MNQSNGQTISDLKKNASRVGSEMKSDLRSDSKVDVKSGTLKTEKIASPATNSASSMANSVLSSAISFLPMKGIDEVYSMLETSVKDVQSNIVAARDSANAFVRKYPFYSLLGAAVLGASAVMLFRARHSSSPTEEIKYDA